MDHRLIALLIASSVPSPTVSVSQADLNSFAAEIGVRLEILDNKPGDCPGQASGCFLSELDLRMPDKIAPGLASGNFKLYFSSVNPVIEADSSVFAVRLVNGDLHELDPRAGVTLEAGSTYRIKLFSQGHFFSAFYPMPNMFLVSDGLKAKIITATRPRRDPDSGLEILPFVAPMINEARLATQVPDDQTRWQTPELAFDRFAKNRSANRPIDIAILPTPAFVRRLGGPSVNLKNGVRLHLSGIERPAIAAALADLAKSGVREGSDGPELRVSVLSAAHLNPESYRLTVRDGLVTIIALDASGARYALESLAQEAEHEHFLLRPAEIADSPRFSYRGVHIDLARNFHTKAEIFKIIELMGRYKLNKLHLHLSDDEGWRLEIAGLPELTRVGAFRCYDPGETHCLLPQLGAGPERESPVNGYLTGAAYIEILRAANARGIEVIPEFDVPGHSRAAIRSMEARYRRLMGLGRKKEAEEFRLVEPLDRTQYRSVQNYNDNTLNPCLESTYRFIGAVVDGVARLHSAAGIPLKTYHIGTDETAGAWSGSPACSAFMAKTGLTLQQLAPMFIERVAQSLARRSITVAGWSDGLGRSNPAKMPRSVQSDVWGDLFSAAPSEAQTSEERKWKTIIAVPNALFFDVPYAPNPLERGYDWPTRGTDTFKVFSFLPDNLPANGSVMEDIKSRPATVTSANVSQASPSGVQAQMWSETVRTDKLADYMLFPRILAFAERAWHRAEWEPRCRPGATYTFADGKVDMGALRHDWSDFSAKISEHLRALERMGIMYRLAPPGARIVDGMLEANSEFPGQRIEFRPSGSPWAPYRGPVRVSGPVQLRTRTYDGRRTSRIVEVPSP